jgi:hypothetical protein
VHAMRRPRQTGAPPAALLEVSIRKAAPPWPTYCVGQREAGRYHRTDLRVLLAEDAVHGGSRPAGSDIVEAKCEFLARTDGQIEGKQCSLDDELDVPLIRQQLA